MTLSNNIQLHISSTVSATVGVANASGSISRQTTDALPDADALFTTADEISDGSNTYDLHGALTDPIGDVVTFDEVHFLWFRNTSENVMTLGGTLAVLSDGIAVPAGGEVMLKGVYAVAGNAREITISGTDTDEYELVVIGVKPE